jgi:hypothetical protein
MQRTRHGLHDEGVALGILVLATLGLGIAALIKFLRW